MLNGKSTFSKYLKRIVIAAIAVYLAFRLHQTLQLLLTSLFLAGAITPIIEKITSFRVRYKGWELGLNRVLAIALLYLFLMVIVILAIAPAPQIMVELGQFFTKLPTLLEQIQLPKGGLLNLTQDQLNRILQAQPLIDQVQNLGRDIASQTFGFTLQFFKTLG